MIRNTKYSGTSFVPKTSYIPVSWKKWYALIHGINTGQIVPQDTEEDGYGNPSLADIIDALRADSIVKGMPAYCYDKEESSDVVNALSWTINRIREELAVCNASVLSSFNQSIQNNLASIQDDAELAIEIIRCYHDDIIPRLRSRTIEEAILNARFFDRDQLKPLYELTVCKCFGAMTFDDFFKWVNTEYDSIVEYNRLLKPRDMDFSFYTLLVILVLGHETIRDGLVGPHFSCQYWGRTSSEHIDWGYQNRRLEYKPRSDQWVEFFMMDGDGLYFDKIGNYNESVLIPPSDITQDDQQQLEQILSRPTFHNLCSIENLARNNHNTFSFDPQYVFVTLERNENQSLENLRKLLSLIHKETTYLIDHKERISSSFVDSESADDILRSDSIIISALHDNLELLDDYVLNRDIDQSLFVLLGDLIDSERSIPLNNKPRIDSLTVKTFIDSCISANFTVQKMIRDSIMEHILLEVLSRNLLGLDRGGKGEYYNPNLSDSGALIPKSDDARKISNDASLRGRKSEKREGKATPEIEKSIKELLRKSYIIERENEINYDIRVSVTDLVRFMVEKMLIKPTTQWCDYFESKEKEYKAFNDALDCKKKDKTLELENEKLRPLCTFVDLTTDEQLPRSCWAIFDNVFYKNGKPLSAGMLRKAFIDNDRDMKYRAAIITRLFASTKHKT